MDLSCLNKAGLHHTPRYRPRKLIGSSNHAKVRQANLQRIASRDRRHAEVAGIDHVLGDVELEVAAVVALVPLQLGVVSYEKAGLVCGALDGAAEARGGDGCAGELDAYGTFAGGRVVARGALECSLFERLEHLLMLVKPHEV